MTQLAEKQSTAPAGRAAVQHAGTSPGKSTLVGRGEGGDGADVHAAADRGTQGGGARMPFSETIQRSFGAHDISGIRAHTGGAAADANAQMGSKAFARGSDVAFGGAPDLHTAAHEAAHVVQQRSGVSLKGGVGAAGDSYERHADAVADKVVAGQSAEGLLTQMAGAPGGGGGAAAVQHAPIQFLEGDAPAPAADKPNLKRVQAATGASDLAQVRAAQKDLVPKLAASPSDPDLRDAVATARTWTMDRVAEIRDRFEPRVKAQQMGKDVAADSTDGVEKVEIEMDAACTPYLDALLEGDPQYRYYHFDHGVQDKVFAAVRLHALRRGTDQIGHRDDAEKEARKEGGLGDKDAWCGAFAYTQQEKGGGMDPYWKVWMQGEGGIRSALAYAGMASVFIWTGDSWQSVRDYHKARGSERYYAAITKGPPAQGIQPGDLVLIDNHLGTNPDHITTAISFDGRYLTTVGGNQGAGELGVSRSGSAIDLEQNADPNDVSMDSTDKDGKPIKIDDPKKHKNWRVHGVGRWSIVDYETHVYATPKDGQKPTKPPTDAAVGAKSK